MLAASAGAHRVQRGDVITLRVWSSSGSLTALPIMIGNFGRVYPDIKLDVQFVASSNALGALYATSLRAGNAADILQFVPGKGITIGATLYGDAGYLVDLAGRPLEKRMPQVLLVGLKTGKHIWAYSTGASLYAMFYNKDMFAQSGWKVPTTFAQVLALCTKIAAAGKIPIAASIGDGGRGLNNALMLAANDVYAKTPDFNVKRAHYQTSFASSGWKKVLEDLTAMKDAKCFSPGVVGTGADAAPAQFARGEAAMYAAQSANYANWTSVNPTLNFGAFALPADNPADTRTVINPPNLWGVNAATTGATRDAALKFIDFIARPKQTETFNTARGAILSGLQLQTATIPAYFPELQPLAPILKRRNPLSSVYVWPNPFVTTALNAAMVGIFTGQKTVDQGLTDMDNAFNRGTG
jgi:raffinose/stachyose/melibiose transport system substrate-binding protein